MVLLMLLLLVPFSYGGRGGQPLQQQISQTENVERAEPLPAAAEGHTPQYRDDLRYNVLEPQFQYSSFSFINNKQPYPRVQPQIIFYNGAALPGQQFLVQPGAPPGNFLIPQPHPGPGIVLRDGPPRPFFAAGYPKPDHVPPIEKDAEEIPTTINRGIQQSYAPFPRPTGLKPEKLETFDDFDGFDDHDKPATVATEADVLAQADKNLNIHPKKPTFNKPTVKPVQRFYILGQPQFQNSVFQIPQQSFQPGLESTFPSMFVYQQGINTIPQVSTFQQNAQFDQTPFQNFFIRNAFTGQSSDVKQHKHFISPSLNDRTLQQDNAVSLNQPSHIRESVLVRNALPLTITPVNTAQKLPVTVSPTILSNFDTILPDPGVDNINFYQTRISNQAQSFPILNSNVYGGQAALDYYRYSQENGQGDDADSVVINAKEQSSTANDDSRHIEVSSGIEKSNEPAISQAQPGAIALAGVGGVAAAAPRGTAVAGAGGLAVSRPQATAVAGPRKDSEDKKKPKK